LIRMIRNRAYFFTPFVVGLLCENQTPSHIRQSSLLIRMAEQLNALATLLASSHISTQWHLAHISSKQC
jgi:hypothetical protein